MLFKEIENNRETCTKINVIKMTFLHFSVSLDKRKTNNKRSKIIVISTATNELTVALGTCSL
jgi:hypothetical protein